MSKELAKKEDLTPIKFDDLVANENMEVMGKATYVSALLAHPPHPTWLQQHPTVKHVKSLPIGRVEWLLTTIFKRWRVEVLSTQVIANSVCVTVRLHYWNPYLNEWDCTDGIGAVDIQTKSGKSATDAANVIHGAIMRGAPAAKSYAIKNAASEIGPIFGRGFKDKDLADAYMGLKADADIKYRDTLGMDDVEDNTEEA